METKTIILADKGPVEMTFEQVLHQFKGTVHDFANKMLEKIVYNKPEKEDLVQELNIQVYEAWKRYNGKNAFSTYLHYRLQLGTTKVKSPLFAQKRTNTKGVVSLNDTSTEDDLELEGLLGVEDANIESVGFREFIKGLEKTLNTDEKKMLKVFINREEYSVQQFADELKISRQGANKKVVNFKSKLACIMKQTGYVS